MFQRRCKSRLVVPTLSILGAQMNGYNTLIQCEAKGKHTKHFLTPNTNMALNHVAEWTDAEAFHEGNP